ILQLTQGVIGMSVFHVKLLAAGVLLSIGLGLGGGAGGLANAEAQSPYPPNNPAAKQTPEEKVKQLDEQPRLAKADAEKTPRRRPTGRPPAGRSVSGTAARAGNAGASGTAGDQSAGAAATCHHTGGWRAHAGAAGDSAADEALKVIEPSFIGAARPCAASSL